MKTIEMVKGPDGVFRESKAKPEPQEASFKNRVGSKPLKSGKASRGYARPDYSQVFDRINQEINNALEEVGIEALNILTRGFFKR